MIRRRHPTCDLGARVEAELVQDVANVALDGAFGYEQTRADLFVGQALSQESRDIGLALPEYSGAPMI
ncbi:hypothetical protein GCM10023196_016150 [Actinoallomurus vinaceus]|uniref:Uncharacterized protein n=1 Tax=Actinoallomurus vinaceus TaxID=1080074 RepID=A0ABP8U307_9ACTN